MKRRLLLCLICLIFVSGCVSGIVVEQSGEIFEVSGKAFRYVTGYLQFPESDYSKSLDFSMGLDFADTDDPTYWERAHEAIIDWNKEVQSSEFFYDTFENGVPPLNWLKENTIPYTGYYYLVEAYLPPGGALMESISEDMYKDLRKRKSDSATHLIINDEDVFLYDFGDSEEEGVYFIASAMDFFLESNAKKWIYRFPDNISYLVIDKPQEISIRSLEELDRGPLKFEVQVPILVER